MIARLHVQRGDLSEYPLAERVPHGWQNGVTFYPDAEVERVMAKFRLVSVDADTDALLTQEEARVLVSGASGWSAALWDKLRRIAGDA